MQLSEVVGLLKSDYPGLLQSGIYIPPASSSSRWVLIAGPAYGYSEYRGSLIVEASEFEVWAEKHNKGCWCSVEVQQRAAEYLPVWLSQANLEDESITLLDEPFKKVTEHYHASFLEGKEKRIFCPECHELDTQVNVICVQSETHGLRTNSTREWRCLKGHLIQRNQTEFRRFCKRRSEEDETVRAILDRWNGTSKYQLNPLVKKLIDSLKRLFNLLFYANRLPKK